MMNAGDAQSSEQAELLAFSQRLLGLRGQVLDAWLGKVRSQLPGARELRHPILMDTFPALYLNLVEALTPDMPRALATSGTTIAAAHGSERARMSHYHPQEVVREYQLLRETLLEQVQAAGVAMPPKALVTINMSIDTAIIEAVTEFGVVHARLQAFFVAALSHDMRTPLATAGMAAQLALRKIDDEDVRALMHTIRRSVTRIDHMIGEMLDDLAGHPDGLGMALELSSFDLMALAREVCEGALGGACNVQLSGVPSPGYWCRDALKRALENLLGNALKYGDCSQPILIHLARTDGRQLMSVYNEGPPISRDKMGQIFTAYFRDDDKPGQGWGVGLPFVKAVAESHGGSISVDSSAERGTTFMLDLPIDARPYQPALLSDPLPPAAGAQDGPSH
jgi:signal transduction histidine kinase